MLVGWILLAANATRGDTVETFEGPDPTWTLAESDCQAQALVFFTITVAAAEVAVGLAIIVALFRAKQSVDVGAVEKMKG